MDMEEGTSDAGVMCEQLPIDTLAIEGATIEEKQTEDETTIVGSDCVSVDKKDESGVILDVVDDCKDVDFSETNEVNEDTRSLGDLDSLPAGDELVLGAAGSDSGVEGCGRALSSGGGSRSCASSVVSCGSGCGSESSSLAGAPSRARRRVNLAVNEQKRGTPVGSSTPRPATAPRGPNLATRERARSREKPTPPEKPRPLTPKPRIRPSTDLPNLVRESPALRAKPTKTSTARCRTPNSPCDEKKWPMNGPRLPTVADAVATRVAADKYGTLPRRRRDPDQESSPKHEITPPSSKRPSVTRSVSSRSTTKTRVRIYAEKTVQTILLGFDIESALAGIVPNIERQFEVSRCHRGVQVCARDSELGRLTSAAATAQAAAEEERARRVHAEAQLAVERAARVSATAELERNTQRLLDLAGAAGTGAGAEGCLRALEEQLRSASELATRQRAELDALRHHCDKLHAEACSARESVRSLEARLAEAEREAAEMQDFLAAETGALSDSLREAETELQRANTDLDRSRGECRQLVRMCEQRRQEALGAAARARSGGGAAHALDALARRLRALTAAVLAAYRLQPDAPLPTVYHNDAFSRSDSGEALTPEGEGEPRCLGSGLLSAVSRALRAAPPVPHHVDDDRSRLSDDNDNSADLLDSETEPCLITDAENAEEWWSGAEGGGGAWSGDELSPERECEPESATERDSLRQLSAAITHRQRSEEDADRGSLVERVVAVDNRLTELLRALRLAAAAAATDDDHRLALALRDKIDLTEKNVADVVVKKLAELDASKNMMEQYQQSIETLKKQLSQSGEEDDLDILTKELSGCSESERRGWYEALDAAAGALAGRGGTGGRDWPRLQALHARLERLAFAAATPSPPHQAQQYPAHPALHTTA